MDLKCFKALELSWTCVSANLYENINNSRMLVVISGLIIIQVVK